MVDDCKNCYDWVLLLQILVSVEVSYQWFYKKNIQFRYCTCLARDLSCGVSTAYSIL